MSRFFYSCFIVLSFFACSEEPSAENVSNQSDPFKNLVVDDSNTQITTPVEAIDIFNNYKLENNLPDSVRFINIDLVKGEDTELHQNYFLLRGQSEDGTISVAFKAERVDGQYKMTGESCECKGACSSGCEVIRMCACSRCFPEQATCIKTHKKGDGLTNLE